MELNPNQNNSNIVTTTTTITTAVPILSSSSISSLLVASSLIGPLDTTSITTNFMSSEVNSSNNPITMTTPATTTTTIVASASNSKSMKHFKKSMIVEYERIESNGGIDESSHSSTASSSSNNSNSNSNSSNGVGESCQAATSFANTVISKTSSHHHHHHHHHHHLHQQQQNNSTETKKSESESTKKRKRKSIDETDKNAIVEERSGVGSNNNNNNNNNVSLSTVVAAAAQFNSDLYEDESGDSLENDYSKISHPKTFEKSKTMRTGSEFNNEISGGELSDGNTRSDFDMPDTNSSNNHQRSSELKEVKRKKIHDTSLVENNSMSSSMLTSKKTPKTIETDSKKDSSKHSLSKHKISSSSSKMESSNKKSSEKPVDKPSNLGEMKEPKADKKNLEVYCICKSSDSTRFMIACDKCDEWYHGDCVGITQSLSKRIKIFYCHLCRQKKSSLKIKYKSQFQEMSKNLTKENVRQQENSANGENLVKFFKETQARKKKEAELLKGLTISSTTLTAAHSSTNSSEKKNAKPSNPTNKTSNTLNANKNEMNTDISVSTSSSISTTSSSSTKPSDENKTVFDSPTISSLSLSSSKLYGKTNVSGEDIANFFSAITKLNSTDAHVTSSATINSTTTTVTNSNNQVSSTTNEVTSSSSPSKTNTSLIIKKSKADSDSHDESGSIKKQKTSNLTIFNSENSNSAADDEHESDSNDTSSINTDAKETNDSSEENRNNDQDEENDSSDSDFSGFDNRHTLKARRKSEDSQRSASNLDKSGKNFKNKQIKPQNKKSTNANAKKISTSSNAIKTKNPKSKTTKTVKQPQQKKRLNRNSSSTNQNDLDDLEQASNDKLSVERKEPRQCQGPECIREAYENSKYCSYECGMRLAKDRLVNFLKLRLDQYNEETPLSTKLNQTELERCNYEIDQLKKHLSNLEKKHEDLDKVIARAKFEKINPNVEKEREKLIDSSETEIYCVTCGQICSEKHALKHMEKCFNKLESQAFFGSFYKTHIEGKSMFCDFYNTQTKMYCKRLKVMCPEHEKEKKVNDDEVCGCPLPKLIEYDDQTLDSTNIELCLAPKRTCSIHFKWEKLRRAQIDLEKLRAWLKMEELLEQKKLHETSLVQRGGLLSVLLHQTTSNTQMDTENSTIEVSTTMDVDAIHKNDTQLSAIS